jgi:hypothetical protein
MKLAIMQPYFFPYIGYWQLINAVDTFVIFDDVNFIKKGYINRNSILASGSPHLITLELIGASQNKLINEIAVGDNGKKLLTTIRHSYSKAPYFNIVFPIIEDILNQDERNLAKYLGYSLRKVSDYLEIRVNFIFSSHIEKNNSLKGQDKILDICEKLNTTRYVNSIGGQGIYNEKFFNIKGVSLNFLEMEFLKYEQFESKFIHNLSIIDLMMFNSKEDIERILNNYYLI